MRAQSSKESSAPAPQPDTEKLIDIDADAKAVSSTSNPYEDAFSSIGSLGARSAVDTRHRLRTLSFYRKASSFSSRCSPRSVSTMRKTQLGKTCKYSYIRRESKRYTLQTDTFYSLLLGGRHHSFHSLLQYSHIVVWSESLRQ